VQKLDFKKTMVTAHKVHVVDLSQAIFCYISGILAA